MRDADTPLPITPAEHKRLRRKYLGLGVGELVAAAVFAALAASGALRFNDTADGTLALWSALTPLLVILLQAGTYWLLARNWIGQPFPHGVAAVYHSLRVLNPVLLLAGLAGTLFWLPSGATAVLVLGVWLFGVVEYVNYFVARLAYPISRWPSHIGQWRTPQLVKDIRRAG